MSPAAARRTALAAQGFSDRPPTGPVTRRHLQRVLARTRLLQLDSVSVAVRAHQMPVFSRLGAYDRDLLDAAAWCDTARRPRLLAEYWAHEAALIPVQDWPLLRWRMRARAELGWRAHEHALVRSPALVDDVLAAVTELGPSTAGQLEAALEVGRVGAKGPWWDRSDTKIVCEHLFSAGVLTTATRVAFARHYDLAERVLPPDVLAREVDDDEAVRTLVAQAATALGVATEPDLRDYYRLPPGRSQAAVADLVEAGVLVATTVPGWPTAYLHRDAPTPRWVRGAALLCPFDPLIFCRARTERVFGFRYRLEIYTPQARRTFGYYVFPFLLDGELVARVDLKTDRAIGTLRVLGAFCEDGRDRAVVAEALTRALEEMAAWLGVEAVTVGDRGDLAEPLRRSVGSRG
ncbi:MAG: crosslink repair DNA glycosylase YcaQ family protein [Mycobacteriaceae bacterium]